MMKTLHALLLAASLGFATHADAVLLPFEQYVTESNCYRRDEMVVLPVALAQACAAATSWPVRHLRLP